MSGRPPPPRNSRNYKREPGQEFAYTGRKNNSNEISAANTQGNDRIGELRAAGINRNPSIYDLTNEANASQELEPNSVSAVLNQIKESDSKLSKAKKLLPNISSQQSRMLDALTEKDRASQAKDLERAEYETRAAFDSIRKMISLIDRKVAGFQRGSADYVMVYNQLASHKSRYQRSLQDFHSIRVEYSKLQKNRLLREMRIVNPQTTEADVEEMLENGDNVRIFAQNIQNSSRYQDATRVLGEVKSRHDDIAKIEESIIMLHDLFIQVNDLITVQDEQIAHIEVHAEDAVVNIEEGKIEVEKAIVSRKKQIGLLFTLSIILILIIAGLGLYYGLKLGDPKTN